MIASDLTRGVLIIMLAFATSIWQIYAILFAVSCVSTFFMPAQSVTIPLLVKREGLMAASGLMQQTMQLVRIFSPAAASGLVGLFGEAACYYADSLTFFVSAAILATLSYHRPVTPAKRGLGPVLSELWQGIKFILTHPTFSFVILSMTAGTFALGCFGALISVYVRDVLHGTAYLFGAIGSLIGVGSISGAMFVRKVAAGRPPAILISGAMFGIGVFILLMAFAAKSWTTLACSAGIGVCVAFLMVAATTLLQGETPPEMRGRVSSSSMSMIAMSQGFAMLFAGSWATRFGITNLFYASAVMLFIVAFGGLGRARRLV
jgi:MFS family permease